MYKFLLSSRYLRTRFIALASIISVMLGVATMIVVNAVMAGFSGEMRERIHGILADVVIESVSTDGVQNPDQLIELAQQAAGDQIEAITPTVEIYGMLSFDWVGQTIHRPVTLIGIEPNGKDLVSPLKQYLKIRSERPQQPLDWELSESLAEERREWLRYREMTAASFSDDLEAESVDDIPQAASPFGNAADDPSLPFGPEAGEEQDPYAPYAARAYVGAGLISFPNRDPETGQTETLMMVRPGMDVKISTIKSGVPDVVGFNATVVDIFHSGMSEYDSNLIFCNLEELQANRGMLLRAPGEPLDWRRGSVTSLQIRLKDYDQAGAVVERLAAVFPRGQFQIRTWEQKQGPLLEAVDIEATILNILLFLIIAVAGFGILAIFYMIVVEKTRDIGILKALGASSRGVMSIFLSYGLSLGIVGSGVGVLLGLTLVYNLGRIESFVSWLTGREVFDRTIYYFDEIPTAVHASTVCWVAVGAMTIAVLASVLPARRAARLHPVEALRYE